ncbi:hypothetical protein D3C72_926120 [compost metagenome]
MVVAVLLIAGDQVPMIPLLDCVGRAAKVVPAQMAGTCVNPGSTTGLTVIVIVVLPAHWFALGVNVYVVVAVLLIAGNHVPIIPLVDCVGKAAKAAPAQMAGTCVKAGVTGFVTASVAIMESAPQPPVVLTL